ncbi:MAG: flagellar hook-associated protein FlgL [Myxococcota bacterium]|jgi:flagellar hook-associated protein 3 FlgL|nr:flagellar hook-associated protein FlgL [Myxococcota bacterium]
MRVTERMVFRQTTFDIGNKRAEYYDLQRQGATQKKFQELEEDPISAERIRLLREAKQATLHFEKNITRSHTQLEAADEALGEATNVAIRAKELALSASNETWTAMQRSIIADEVDSLFKSMVGVANTQAAGEYVFGGFLTDQRPFLDNGTYIGNDNQKEIDVGPNARQVVNVSGARAFTVTGGNDVFASLDSLRTALRNNDVPAVRTELDNLDNIIDQLSRGRTDAGLKLNQLDVASAVRNRLEDALTKEESRLLDIDPVKVFLELNETGKALQDAIAVSDRVTNMSFVGQ